MMSDFAPELAKYPTSSPNPKIAKNSERVYCLTPWAMQLAGGVIWLMCVFVNVTVLQLWVWSNVPLLLEHQLLLYQMPAGALAPGA